MTLGTLQRAIEIAVQAHAGQVDKAGSPYILHPLRVMLAQNTDAARIVGVLHDVVEDCAGWTFVRLGEEGFSDEILEALASVTKRPEDEADYQGFIARSAGNRIGRTVKMADLIDNSDLSRIATPTAADHQRVEKYQAAIAYLQRAAPP